MRKISGRYECAYCGEVLDIERDAVPTVMFHEADDQRDTHVMVDGREVHRCERLKVTRVTWHVAAAETTPPIA